MRKEVIIHLVEPSICVNCRFALIAKADTSDGPKRLIHCTRGDCDNWGEIADREVKITQIEGQL